MSESMPESKPVHIEDTVSDTLFIPLYMRSLETRRLDGIINDPLSCELVERIDYDFAKYKNSPKSQLGCAIRLRRFDQAVYEFVRTHDNPVVVQLGAGLDTRYQRVNTGKGVFYDLDLPEVMEFRQQLLPETKDNPYIAGSMFETAWIDRIKEENPDGQFIIVAEGVFMYFEAERIRSLVTEIADRLAPGELHFDACSPWAVKNSRRHETVKRTDASFKWGIRDDLEVEQWSPNLQYVGTTNYFSTNNNRWGMLGLLSKLFPGLRNAYRLLHYEIGGLAA